MHALLVAGRRNRTPRGSLEARDQGGRRGGGLAAGTAHPGEAWKPGIREAGEAEGWGPVGRVTPGAWKAGRASRKQGREAKNVGGRRQGSRDAGHNRSLETHRKAERQNVGGGAEDEESWARGRRSETHGQGQKASNLGGQASRLGTQGGGNKAGHRLGPTPSGNESPGKGTARVAWGGGRRAIPVKKTRTRWCSALEGFILEGAPHMWSRWADRT
ncbi:hypothetical protein CYMTET_33590 [Cymbomonas tetramitiformis]|uniref:Uncharacterized protein n=1 Tax=Cymbomonas tetramitiformis TaxID=36881 RepID=A0AAE0FCU8_9CHLO|nr:hypothetical protein CYMTET_33590 [Cymbomonas tetramitiformis]